LIQGNASDMLHDMKRGHLLQPIFRIVFFISQNETKKAVIRLEREK